MEKQINIKIDSSTKNKFERRCEELKVSQKDAVSSMIEFFIEADEETANTLIRKPNSMNLESIVQQNRQEIEKIWQFIQNSRLDSATTI